MEPIFEDGGINIMEDLKFITHRINDSWGFTIVFMEENGKAFARLYQYNDLPDTIYLASLSVDEDVRRKGIGTKLQEIREKIGSELGATSSCLWVIKDTWMHEWYKRRGYQDYESYNLSDNTVWMKKLLK